MQTVGDMQLVVFVDAIVGLQQELILHIASGGISAQIVADQIDGGGSGIEHLQRQSQIVGMIDI